MTSNDNNQSIDRSAFLTGLQSHTDLPVGGGAALPKVRTDLPPVGTHHRFSRKSFAPNAFAGNCINCGGRVEANQGLRDRGLNGHSWVVFHRDGDCASVPAEAPESPSKAPHIVPATKPGIYTVETPEGHRTFRVRVQGADEDFAPGRTVLEYLRGRDNDNDYTGFAFINAGGKLQVWKRFADNADLIRDAEQFLANPDDALVSINCLRCDRTLTHPDSVYGLYGPECIKKVS